MRILKIIGFLLLVVVAIVAFLGWRAAGPYSVTESANIKGNTDVVWKNIADLKSFSDWNPWAKEDPNIKVTFNGDPMAVGSSYSWVGNKNVGVGSMTTTELVVKSKAVSKLNFKEPMEDEATTVMTMEPNADGTTKVSWTMQGENKFPASIFAAVFNMDKMLRTSFQKGFTLLQEKVTVESASAPQDAGGNFKIEEKQFAGGTFVTVRKEVAFADIPKFYQENFGKMFELCGKTKVKMAGPPCGIYYKYDMEKQVADLAAAIPVAAGSKVEGYSVIDVAEAPYYHLDYYGAYEKMEPAYNALDAFAKGKGKEPNPYMVIEQYVSDPMTEKDTTKWLTQIHYFLK